MACLSKIELFINIAWVLQKANAFMASLHFAVLWILYIIVDRKNKNITHIFILLNPTPSVISKLSKNGTINIDKYPAPTILAAIDALCRTSTVGIVRVVNVISIPSHNAYQLI